MNKKIKKDGCKSTDLDQIKKLFQMHEKRKGNEKQIRKESERERISFSPQSLAVRGTS